jgi:transmembrane sensor
MSNDTSYYTDLISRYFFGETDFRENEELASWLKADPANKTLFREYKAAWEKLALSQIESSTDLDAAWERIASGIDFQDSEEEAPVTGEEQDLVPEAPYRFTISQKWMLRIAAIIFFIAVPAFLLIFYLNKPLQKNLTASTEMIESRLPDGTAVTLNTGSILTFPSRFTKGTRNVGLSGEAWFEVAHDASKPFIIYYKDIRLEVLGTSFYVNTDVTQGSMEVILSSGKVSVYYAENATQRITLLPGEKAEIGHETGQITKSVNQDENFLSWKTKKFIFSNDSLKMIIPLLNKVYASSIELKDESLGTCLLTATFDRQSLESILKVMASTLDLKVDDSGGSIEISGKGCR